MRMKWIAVLGVLLFAAQVSAEETPGLKTQSEKMSYAMGVELATNLKRQGVETVAEPLLRGFRDALTGEKLLMNQEDLFKYMSVYRSEVRRRQNEVKRKQTETRQKQMQDRP